MAESTSAYSIPTGYPGASFDAVNLLCQRTRLSLDDLYVMSLIEAAGESYYQRLASGVGSAEARDLLLRNAREERHHAERLIKAIALLGGGARTLPEDDDNPYVKTFPMPPPDAAGTAAYFQGLVQAEDDGYDMYERWATGESNAEVATLYRLNAREETLHGKRVTRVCQLLS